MNDDKGFTIEVASNHGLYPWNFECHNLTCSRGKWVKQYIHITDYGPDGELDRDTTVRYRVRSRDKEGNLTICRPEDDDEPDVFPGKTWLD